MVAFFAPVSAQAAASPASHIPASAKGPVSAEIARSVGRNAVPAVGGGYNVRLSNGRVLHTHGPDSRESLAGGSRTLFSSHPTRAPVCVPDPATDYHQKVLYGFVTGQTNNSVAAIPTIRTIFQQLNYILNQAALESSGSLTTADYKVACNGSSEIDVGVFSTTDTSFGGITSAAAAATPLPFNGAKVDYTIFFDSPAVDYCGVGDFYTDESLDVDNANNNPTGAGPSYGVTHGGPSATPNVDDCWPTTTPMHENGHNQGAVQENAPQSTGPNGHCSQDVDVMCYDDDGDPSTFPMTSDCATEKYDCGYDDYFDAATEGNEYLANNWNIGSTLNRFIQFGLNGAQVRVPASLAVNENTASNGPVTAPVTVQRIGDPSVAFSVDFATAPGTGGTSSADFTDADQTLNFAANENSKTVNVAITTDSVKEIVENISLTLTNTTNGVTIDTSTRVIAIRASDQQPDGYLKLSGGSYKGSNIYNTTGVNQTVATSGAPGVTKTFFMTLQNDGNVPNTIRVKGVNSSGTIITFKIGTTNVTTSIKSSTGRAITLAAGAAVSIRVDFKMGSSASGTESFLLTSTWTGDRVIADRVKGTVSV